MATSPRSRKRGAIRRPHTGHALRHSYRTLAAAAGIDRFRLKILMNHAIDHDVTDAYANVPALYGSLMEAQERISKFIIESIVLDLNAAQILISGVPND